MDGDQQERNYVNLFDAAGASVMRAPASGSATERDMPDALVGFGNIIIATELKTRTDPTAYFTAEEVEALETFGEKFHTDCEVRLAVRWSGDTSFYHKAPEDVSRTPSGNYSAKIRNRDEWETAEDLIERHL